MKTNRKPKIKGAYTPVPHTRAHSDRVRVNRKERRREAKREAREAGR